LAWTCLQPSSRNPAPRRFASSRRRWRSPRTDHTARASLVTRVFSVGRFEWIALVQTYPRGQEQGLMSPRRSEQSARTHFLSRFGLEMWYPRQLARLRGFLPCPPQTPQAAARRATFLQLSSLIFPILPPKSLAGDGRRCCYQPQAIVLIPHRC
jgi:hypothetical protein